jgi:hypothetical protein
MLGEHHVPHEPGIGPHPVLPPGPGREHPMPPVPPHEPPRPPHLRP